MNGAYDAALVIARLEDAGRTMMALQVPGCRPAGYRSSMPEVVRAHWDAYNSSPGRVRLEAPTAAAIGRMEQALSWVRLIPEDRVVYRKLVLIRTLMRPHLDRPIHSWRAIGTMLGISERALRGYHADAISIIVGRLNAPGFCAAAGGRFGLQRGELGGALGRALARAPARPAVRTPAKARARELT